MKMNKLWLWLMCAMATIALTACDNDTVTDTNDEENNNNDYDSVNVTDHEDLNDYVWDESEVVEVQFNGSSIQANDDGIEINGSVMTVTAAGTYRFNGNLSNGQVIVDTDDEEVVRLILNGASINCTTSAPIHVADAEKVVIILPEGTESSLVDGSSYYYDDPGEDEPNAALFSKADLTIYGGGLLRIDGNYNDAVASKDGLIIAGAQVEVTSVDDGIRGKDYLIVRGGEVTVNADGDGLKSTNDEDSGRGYVAIEEGTVDITAGGDAIDAATDALITGGTISIVSGGGSSYSVSGDASAKGIKAEVLVQIDGGTIDVSAADDAVHSNNVLIVNGGSLTLSSADDGIHADSDLTIEDGKINITKCYEGIESADGDITINGGEMHIVSSDDAINVAGGGDSGPGQPVASGDYLYVNGGYIAITSVGDGIDINGSIRMSDGIIIINGPTSSGNGAIDYDASFSITGGYLLALGSSGMAQGPGSSSSQCSVMMTFWSTQRAGKLLNLQTTSGETLFTFMPSKSYQSVVFSSSSLKTGSTYNVYTGGSTTGTAVDGLYSGGTYTPGSQLVSFTQKATVTKVSM
ncbi:MAG TPA: carbohydrate-binding domain-containing protein [candidate division Zixibacteria bacterium]|nr:carbohydrate-binding domain-containing protein [candidate division Zixibacteria bacterium]